MSQKIGRLLHALYQGLGWCITPFFSLFLLTKKVLYPPLRQTLRERRAVYTKPSEHSKPVLWVHAASIGEAKALLPFLEKFLQETQSHKGSLVFTTMTKTSQKVLCAALSNECHVHLLPYDLPLYVSRFLRYWQPQAVLWTESEIWPNFLARLHKEAIPTILVNGCISADSYPYWKKVYPWIHFLLKAFTKIYTSRLEYKKRYDFFDVEHCRITPNLKYRLTLPKENTELRKISFLGQRFVWMASCTHGRENLDIIHVHKDIKPFIPNLLTVLAPRHPKSITDVIRLVEKAKLSYALLSQSTPCPSDVDIYIIDTIGDLPLLYRKIPIVFLGGSLYPKIGGHNLVEPATYHCALLTGAYMHKVQDIYQDFCHNEACYTVKNSKHLEEILLVLHDHGERVDALQRKSRQLVEQKQEELDGFEGKIMRFLKGHLYV